MRRLSQQYATVTFTRAAGGRTTSSPASFELPPLSDVSTPSPLAFPDALTTMGTPSQPIRLVTTLAHSGYIAVSKCESGTSTLTFHPTQFRSLPRMLKRAVLALLMIARRGRYDAAGRALPGLIPPQVVRLAILGSRARGGAHHVIIPLTHPSQVLRYHVLAFLGISSAVPIAADADRFSRGAKASFGPCAHAQVT